MARAQADGRSFCTLSAELAQERRESGVNTVRWLHESSQTVALTRWMSSPGLSCSRRFWWWEHFPRIHLLGDARALCHV